jgi:hypothetical protein
MPTEETLTIRRPTRKGVKLKKEGGSALHMVSVKVAAALFR